MKKSFVIQGNLQLNRKIYSVIPSQNLEISLRKRIRRQTHNLLMALRQAEKLGLKNIFFDDTYTSCVGLTNTDAEGFGTHFSNVRDKEKKGFRNCFMAALV